MSNLSSVECAKVLGLSSMPILGHEKVPLVEKSGFQTMMRLHVEESELGSPFQTCIWSAPFFRRKKKSGLKMLLINIFHRIQKNISYFINFFRQFNSESRDIQTHFAWSTPRNINMSLYRCFLVARHLQRQIIYE